MSKVRVRHPGREVSSILKMVYGLDGQLRQDEVVVARVVAGEPNTFGRVVVGDSEYDIIRFKRSGWHFAMVRPSTDIAVCEFLPFRVRRGGCLRSENVKTELRQRSLRLQQQWYLKMEDGHNVLMDTRIERGGRFSNKGIEVRLCVEQAMRVDLNALVVLIFSCWLVAQWEVTPVQASGGPPILWENV